MDAQKNPLGLVGIDFIEFYSADSEYLESLFKAFGFCLRAKHPNGSALYIQGGIKVVLAKGDLAKNFGQAHGPSVPSMSWYFEDGVTAYEGALARGARAAAALDYPLPGILGIGDSVLYFRKKPRGEDLLADLGFEAVTGEVVADNGFLLIDHLTNNVEQGKLEYWANFYKNIFGFTEVRYFDIRGEKTGLLSYALRSPDGSFCIPINEGTEQKSQINEYLQEYKGEGVQHIAFLTQDLLASLRSLGSEVETLDIDSDYYNEVFQRVPGVTEDRKEIQRLQVLVDGDAEGYLLQIFTKNLLGPVFIEMIQRKNHLAFGEGNFGALFRAIERDQEKRGFLE